MHQEGHQEELMDCSAYAIEVGFCCRDLMDAMRVVETGGHGDGIGVQGGGGYGPYQIERGAHTDAIKKCGPQYPAPGGPASPPDIGPLGGFGTPPPFGARVPGTNINWVQPPVSPWDMFSPMNPQPDVATDKALSEHIMCCYFRRYEPKINEDLHCCWDLNFPKMPPIGHGTPAATPTGKPIPNPICKGQPLENLEKLARMWNGGPTQRFPKNWKRTDGKAGLRAKRTKIYWEKVCKQFGHGHEGHPGQEKCKCVTPVEPK